MKHDLIVDLGAHNGDDTCYYLRKGFRVVAVEANPILAEQIRGRFHEAVRGGLLTVLPGLTLRRNAERALFLTSDAA